MRTRVVGIPHIRIGSAHRALDRWCMRDLACSAPSTHFESAAAGSAAGWPRFVSCVHDNMYNTRYILRIDYTASR